MSKEKTKVKVIVKKEYPFCPVKVGEELHVKYGTYNILETPTSKSFIPLDEIKADSILMQFLDIKEDEKRIEEYIKETFDRIKKETSLFSNFYVEHFLEYERLKTPLVAQRFFNSELLRTIADDLNEGVEIKGYYYVIVSKYKNNKYEARRRDIKRGKVINNIIFNNQELAEKAIELIGKDRLNTLR